MILLDKKNIKFVGIGAGGSAITEVFSVYDFDTCIINTTPDDSDAIKGVNKKLIIGTEGGCGKDRNLAKESIKNNYKTIVKFLRDKFKDEYELLYIVFTSGGGTGSGSGPMLADILKKVLNKNVGIIVALPSLQEGVSAQGNSIECLKEIYKLNLPTFIVDNEKYQKRNLSIKEYYDSINERVGKDFEMVFNTTRKPSKYGNFDKKDLMKILSTSGMISISHCMFIRDENGNINTNSGYSKEYSLIERLIIESIKSSIYSPIEFDKIIKRMGIIYEIDNSLTKEITYNKLMTEIGTPLETFEGFYQPMESENKTIQRINVILSGLSFPENRLKSCVTVLDRSKNCLNIEKKYEVLESDVSWLSNIRKESMSTGNLKSTTEDTMNIDEFDIDMDELFDKYN